MQLQQEDSPIDSHPSLHQIPTDTKLSLKFDVIVKFFNKVSSINGKQKSKFIRTYISHLFKSNRSQAYVYGILRLILPAEDRERGNYGVKEKSLAILIRDSIGLPTKDYERLKHYKNPSYHQGKQGIGDFPLLASDICSQFCSKESSITIDEVNKILDELVLKIDSKDQIVLFIKILKQCTAEEILWIIRIILKDTKLGIKTDTVFGQYHSDAQEYFNLTNSLKEVTKKFQDKDVSLKSEVMLFHPIKPMLAGKKPMEFFDSCSKKYLLQTKFDGERLQAHINQDQIKLFSRNAKDYTHIYKQLVPIIRENIKTDACILDGEVLIVEKSTFKMIPFGMNKQVALNQDQNPQFQICYKIFDCLWVKCEEESLNLMECQLVKRKEALTKFITEVPGKLQIVRGELVDTKQVIMAKFEESIQRNQEGIMLKDPSSAYVPADRSNNWIKLKGDYYQGLNDTLDIIIIGGYYGDASYRTTGADWTDRITTFLLGVITKLDRVNPRLSEVVPFCKVGTGYSEVQLSELRNRLRKHWIRIKQPKPQYVVGNWKPKVDDRPDCWINSIDNSVLLEVKAAEMIKSDAFGAQKTLRFPRVVKIRYDKEWNQCLNFVDLQSFINNQSTKGLKKKTDKEKQSDSEDEDGTTQKNQQGQEKSKKPKGKRQKDNLNNVLPWFKSIRIHQSQVVSKMFENKQFCILNLKKPNTKSILERKILQHSGTLTQNPISTTSFIISEIIDFKHRSLAFQRSRYAFIKPIYIDACIIQKRLLDLTPLYLSTIPQDKKSYFSNCFDYFGDSYTDLINERELDLILQNMDDAEMFDDIDKEFMERLISKGVYEKTCYAFGIDLSMEQIVELQDNGYMIQSSVNDKTEQIVLGSQLPPNSILIHQMKLINPHLQLMHYREIAKTFN